jgi:DNA-binding NtrC family response regulator
MANEKILVVEGDVLIRLGISHYLREAGFTVIEAASADDAWAYLTAEGSVDLVFSEIATQGALDGVALARSIEANFIALPIILTAGQDRAPPPGGWTFLAKPYAFERAAAAISEALGFEKPKDIP